MTPIAISDGTSQPLTAAGPLAPTTGLDISGLSGAYMISIEVTGLSAASGIPKARIVIEDTVNAFTAALPVAEFEIQGATSPSAPIAMSRTQDECPSLRLGVTSAKLRWVLSL